MNDSTQDPVFRLPDLGEGLQEAEIVSWHVTAGDHVVTDEPLVAVETDKAVVEVPSPRSGRIAKLHAQPGDRVAVGQPLVSFEQGAHADSGTIMGELEPSADAPASEARASIKATPAVRAKARQAGVDLATVTGSGPGGAITASDIARAVADSTTPVSAEPVRGPRRAMAERMARAHAVVVPATVHEEADVGAWPGGASIMPRLIRAMVAGCTAEPGLNAWFEAATMMRQLHASVDLGIAVDLENGLFVPVLRDVGRREPADVRRDLDQLKAEIKTREIAPDRLRGQTITLSNFGTIAGRHAALVVVPPQVAIVGAGRIAPRAVVVEGSIVARPVLPLSLTFDHRAVTGGEAARFLRAMVADLERPT